MRTIKCHSTGHFSDILGGGTLERSITAKHGNLSYKPPMQSNQLLS